MANVQIEPKDEGERSRYLEKFVQHGHMRKFGDKAPMGLWFYVFLYADANCLLKPDYAEIADKNGVSEKAIKKALAVFIKEGFLEQDGPNLRLLMPPDNCEFFKSIKRLEAMEACDDDYEEVN